MVLGGRGFLHGNDFSFHGAQFSWDRRGQEHQLALLSPKAPMTVLDTEIWLRSLRGQKFEAVMRGRGSSSYRKR